MFLIFFINLSINLNILNQLIIINKTTLKYLKLSTYIIILNLLLYKLSYLLFYLNIININIRKWKVKIFLWINIKWEWLSWIIRFINGITFKKGSLIRDELILDINVPDSKMT